MKDNRNYYAKLKDGRWQLKRTEIMQRDIWACCECHRLASCGVTLNVHHRFYKRVTNPWEYENDWLETLCEDCHEKRERAIEIFHRAFLSSSTGELLIWAKRIEKASKKPRRRLEKQAKINKSGLMSPLNPVDYSNSAAFFSQVRNAANGLVALQELCK